MKRPSEQTVQSLQAADPRLHRRAIGPCRHARDRARLRPQERRPRRAQAHACASSPTRAASSSAARSCIIPAPCPRSCSPISAARDADGELIAVPTEWDEEAHGAPPKIRMRVPRRARPGEVAGVGDRALLRVEESGEDDDAIRHSGRVIKIIDRAKQRVLGIFRALPGGGGRLAPIDKKQLGRELAIPPGAGARRAGRRSGRGRGGARPRRPRAADRARHREARLAQERARGQPDRHPRPRHPECLSGGGAAGGRGAPSPRGLRGREDWRDGRFVTIDPADAKDHDDAVHAAPDTDPNNPGGHVISVAIADVAHYVRPGSALDREALVRGNSVYFPDRVVPMLPERISNDLCSLRAGRGPRRAGGAHGGRRRRPQALAQLPPRADALGRQAELPAGAGRDRRPRRRGHAAAGRARAGAALRRLSARSSGRATSARRSISTCPSARSSSSPTAPSTAWSRPSAPGGAPADRGVHDPRQCGGRRNARARARAADLSRARRARSGTGQCAARIPQDARHLAAQGRASCRPRSSTTSSRG